MYKNLIKRIEETVSLNLEHANKADIQRSAFTVGMVKAYIEMLQGMGLDVESGSWDDNGCDRIGYIKIDGVVLVKNSKINFDSYAELLKK